MKRLLGPCLLMPFVYFVMFAYPALRAEIRARLPLLPLYYISKQLTAEVALVESHGDGVPPSYGPIVKEYLSIQNNPDLPSSQSVAGGDRTRPLSERILARIILWSQGLPPDFLITDPVQEIREELADLRRKESIFTVKREELIEKHRIDCLRHHPRKFTSPAGGRRGIPPALINTGLVFCGEAIPLERADVRQRIDYQIEYLLNDLRDTTGIWLKRRDRYGQTIVGILNAEKAPREFCLLPALESGYSCTVVSQSLAKGWWQFVKPTAQRSLAPGKDLDWTLRIDHHVDQRKDLALSTRAAARYLKWMRSKLGNGSEQGGWLTAAAAYNAGLDEIQHRMTAYGTQCYWDMKLPLETEQYVPRWIAFSIIDANREFYGLEVPEIAPLSFETLEGIQLSKDLPLSFLATATESSVRFIRELNSSLGKRENSFKAAGADGEPRHTVHIPAGTKSAVWKALRANAYLRRES